MYLNIIIPCGLLDTKNELEINRFVRFKAQLQSIGRIQTTDNIQFVFAEVGEKGKLQETIKRYVPKSKYVFLENSSFNQIVIWNKIVELFPNFDFVIFSHSDILFPDNLCDILNKRLVDINKNYYAFRFNIDLNYNTTWDGLGFIIERLNNKSEQVFIQEQVYDYGLKYIMDVCKKNYNPVMKYLRLNSEFVKMIQQQPKQIGESFMCISKENWNKLNLDPILNYNNDVAIRDLSVINNIEFEWLNDELIILHMLGLDDRGETFQKKDQKNFEILPVILSKFPQLAHWGLFRFQKKNIPYLKNLDCKFIYENYIKDKMNLYNQKDFWNFVQDKDL